MRPRSALAGFVAALLPPETGRPRPQPGRGGRPTDDRADAAGLQAGLGAALVGLDGLALASSGRRLGSLPPERRQAVLERALRLGGPALDT